VKKQLQHIEDFVRSKLGLLEGDAQTDWLDFERKLRRATRIRQMKRVAGMVGVVLLLGFSQTILSGDWPPFREGKGSLDKTAEGSTPAALEKDLNTATSTEGLKVLHAPSTNNQLVETPTNKPSEKGLGENGRASAKANNTRNTQPANPQSESRLMALAEPEVSSMAPKAAEPIEKSFQERIKPLTGQAKLKPLKEGSVYVGTNRSGASNLPFDYHQPKLSLNQDLMAARAKDYMRAPRVTGPYISPLQEKRSWTYSLNIYPNFAFREFKIDRQKRSLLHSDFIDAMQASEASGVNLNIGFEVSKRIGPITYLNTGVEYINNSYNAEFDFLNFRHANFNSEGEIVDYTLLKDPQRITFTDLNSFHFLNFPLSISYQPWATDHLRINLEFGFSMLYFLEANGSTIDYRTLEPIDLSERSYRKYMASSSLKVGVQYYLSPNMNIGLEPTLMYFTNSIYTEEYPFEVIPYSMGLNLNLQMKLQ
jgi:hypothetical protein